MFEIDDIVCFRENHKWIGCLGFVDEIKPITTDTGEKSYRLRIAVPVPQEGIAYIFATPDEVENLYCAQKYPYKIGEK